MRTTPWRRRRISDSPRPAGRGFRRLRRRGSLARRLVAIRPIQPLRTFRLRRGGDTRVLDPMDLELAPVSPAPLDLTEPDADSPPAPIALLPGERSARRRFYFTLANACTVVSILLGMSAIMLSLAGNVQTAAAVLLGCIIADALDGPLARKFNVASPFGAQMDSLADMCSFGIATPIVVYQWLSGDMPPWAIGGACGLMAVCAAIRLARFNVSPKDGRYFSGVPTTLAAMVLAVGILLLSYTHLAIAVGIAALALTMVSGFPYAKLGQLRRVPAWLWILPAVGLYLAPQATFLALVGAYLLSGPALWAVHQRRRSVIA